MPAWGATLTVQVLEARNFGDLLNPGPFHRIGSVNFVAFNTGRQVRGSDLGQTGSGGN
jgi:hypothetical protein